MSLLASFYVNAMKQQPSPGASVTPEPVAVHTPFDSPIFHVPKCSESRANAFRALMNHATATPSPSPDATDCMNAVLLGPAVAISTDPFWKAIYDETPEPSRAQLALEVAGAFRVASEQQAKYASDEAQWIVAKVARGMTRSQAYAVLRSRGLVAYNGYFDAGKSVEIKGAPGHFYCDTSDHNGGAWPYANEPLPKSEGMCAEMRRGLRAPAHPEASVTLSGAFSIACGSDIYVTLTFDANDRISSVKSVGPTQTCV